MRFQRIHSNWLSQVEFLCYIISQWDREQWKSYLQLFPNVQEIINQGNQKIAGWSLFAEEIFHRLYTLPQSIPYEQLRPEVLWAHQLHLLLDRVTDFSELQYTCRNNRLEAGQATVKLLEGLIDVLPNPPIGFRNPTTLEDWQKRYVEVRSNILALEQTKAELEARIQQTTDSAQAEALNQQIKQIQFDLQKAQSSLATIQAQIGQVQKTMTDYAQELSRLKAELILQAVEDSLHGVHRLRLSLLPFGWGAGMGVLKVSDTREKEETAHRLTRNQRLRQIAEEAGRFCSIAALHQAAKSKSQNPDEIQGTTLGNDFSRLTPSEWTRASLEQTQALFLQDYVNESLTLMQFDGEAEKQGPVVICLDKSESMTWKDREIPSTALMLALVSIAQSQNRKARVILFDDPVRYIQDLDPTTATPQDRLDLASRTYNGGTNFMAPLQAALEAIEDNPDLRKADVIFITDGEAGITEEFSQKWRESQAKLEFRVYTLIVGTYVNTGVLDRFSDHNIYVDDLDDPRVHQVFDI